MDLVPFVPFSLCHSPVFPTPLGRFFPFHFADGRRKLDVVPQYSRDMIRDYGTFSCCALSSDTTDSKENSEKNIFYFNNSVWKINGICLCLLFITSVNFNHVSRIERRFCYRTRNILENRKDKKGKENCPERLCRIAHPTRLVANWQHWHTSERA